MKAVILYAIIWLLLTAAIVFTARKVGEALAGCKTSRKEKRKAIVLAFALGSLFALKMYCFTKLIYTLWP